VGAAAFPRQALALVPAEADALWQVQVDGSQIGQVRLLALDAPVWAAPAYGIELRLAVLSAAPEAGRAADEAPRAAAGMRFRPLPTTPAAERAVSLIVPDTLPAAQVEGVLRREGGELLERVALVDEFRGAGVAPGARSLTWQLAFRHPERTLRDKEIEGRLHKLLKAVEGELGVRQRS
jgi:phenylalanyl-tRNA synthetase beta chain